MTPGTKPPPRTTTFFQLYGSLPTKASPLSPVWAGVAAAAATPGPAEPAPWEQVQIPQLTWVAADKITANDNNHEVLVAIRLAPLSLHRVDAAGLCPAESV